jgi:hypothetical protein
MRWERLFDDLAGQWDVAGRLEAEAEISERTRFARGQVTLGDRLRGSLGTTVALGCRGVKVTGRLLRVAADVVLIEDTQGECLVPLAAIDTLSGAGRPAVPAPEGPVAAHHGFRSMLREIARDRAWVTVVVAGRDGSLRGLIHAVGADIVELAESDADEPVPGRRVVIALQAITLIRLR